MIKHNNNPKQSQKNISLEVSPSRRFANKLRSSVFDVSINRHHFCVNYKHFIKLKLPARSFAGYQAGRLSLSLSATDRWLTETHSQTYHARERLKTKSDHSARQALVLSLHTLLMKMFKRRRSAMRMMLELISD